MVVPDCRGGLGFTQKAFARQGAGGEWRRQHFQGDDPVEFLVERLEDDAEASAATHLEHLVMIDSPERIESRRGCQKDQVGRVGLGVIPFWSDLTVDRLRDFGRIDLTRRLMRDNGIGG